MSMTDKKVLIRIIGPDDHEYVVYSNGLFDGFPEGSHLGGNFLPAFIKSALCNGSSGVGESGRFGV